MRATLFCFASTWNWKPETGFAAAVDAKAALEPVYFLNEMREEERERVSFTRERDIDPGNPETSRGKREKRIKKRAAEAENLSSKSPRVRSLANQNETFRGREISLERSFHSARERDLLLVLSPSLSLSLRVLRARAFSSPPSERAKKEKENPHTRNAQN